MGASLPHQPVRSPDGLGMEAFPMRAPTDTAPVIAVVVDRYPSLEEPFVADQLRGLEERGLSFEIWSLDRPRLAKLHPVQAEVSARVRQVPDSITADPLRTVGALLGTIGAPGGGAAFGAWLRSVLNARAPGVFRHFSAAAVLHAEAPPGTKAFYAMGLGNAAGVARLAAMMRRVPWGCRASEPEVWQLAEADMAERLAEATFCFAPSAAVAQAVRPFLPGGDRVVVAPNAIDLARFTPPPDDATPRSGDSRDLPVRLLSIGRLAENRGYIDLLNALADMPKATHWRLIHIGDGAAGAVIRQHALNLGLGPRVIWRGPCDQTEVLAALRDADIYVQTPRPPAAEQQGLPQAVIEAASQRLPVISTRSSAAADFLVADENALIVRAGQTAVLTETIQRLARDPEERHRLGGNGRLKVEATRNLNPVLDTIAQRLRRAIA